MADRKDKRKGWIVDFVMAYPDGSKIRIRETSPVQNRRGAKKYERERREELLDEWINKRHGVAAESKEVPVFSEWWTGRFWREWVVGQRNKPSEKENKRSIYRRWLEPRFGQLRLDEIVDDGHIPDFRASLVELVDRGALSEKRLNNILAPLSKALRYAEDQRVIPHAPKVGLLKVERPEIVWWEYTEYARLLMAAWEEGPFWYVAVCLAGEAGLRIGEVRALVWERDLDLIAGTLTVNRQRRKGIEGTPKGRNRRTVPMTTALQEALRSLNVIRRGYVVRNQDGSPMRDGQSTHAIYRICRGAGLPERAWHSLRHSFGTHAAMFGVNPWKLMAWLGHKSITETMRYVHVAGDHMRPTPDVVLEAGNEETDPDRRIIAMLGARRDLRARGTILAPKENAGVNPA